MMIIISNNLNYTHMKYPKLGEKYVNSETATQICFHRQRERNSQERLIDWSKLEGAEWEITQDKKTIITTICFNMPRDKR